MNGVSSRLGVLIGLVLVGASGSASFGEDWPSFRGPRGDGNASATGIIKPDQVGLKIAWKKDLGSGYSGVVISDGRVVTGFSDSNDDVIVALDAKDGRELWRFALDSTYKGHDGSHDGPIVTPLIADGRVFAIAPRGRFVALDAKSGKLQWSTDLVKDHGGKKPHYGFTSSPLYADGVVVLQIGSEQGAVAGFDPRTGKRLWAVGEDTVNYESPILYEDGGKQVVLALGDKKMMAVDPKDGTILWEHAHGGGGQFGTPAMSPVVVGDSRILLTNKTDSSMVFEQKEDKSWSPVWEKNTIRKTFNVPIFHDGHIYAYAARFLTCVDAATGESKWRSREPGDGFMVFVDGHLVIATKTGSLHVVEASPEGYHEVASIPLFDDLIWTNPSFADGSIFVRGLAGVARVDLSHARSTTVVDSAAGQPPADSVLGRFLKKLENAEDKKAVIDDFLAKHKSMPITEDSGWVHFVYYGDGEDLAVAGDLFGARQERSMHRAAGTDFFYYSHQTDADARFNYLFLRDYEEIVDPRNPNQTYSVLLTKDMEMSFGGSQLPMSWAAMPKWRKPAHLEDSDSAQKGELTNHSVDSKALGAPVPLQVYLPHGYADGDQRYPVAFVHGGMMALMHGKMETSLNNLCGKQISPMIVVFINHFPRDYQSYADMFATELIPYVDENFRTKASPADRASIGSGFMGLAALYAAAKHPGVVEKVGVQSPFIFEMMRGPIDEYLKGPKELPLTIYMEWGKYDLRNPHESWDMGEVAKEFADSLKKKGYKITGGEVHDGMGWSSWRNRTDVMLKALFPNA